MIKPPSTVVILDNAGRGILQEEEAGKECERCGYRRQDPDVRERRQLHNRDGDDEQSGDDQTGVHG